MTTTTTTATATTTTVLKFRDVRDKSCRSFQRVCTPPPPTPDTPHPHPTSPTIPEKQLSELSDMRGLLKCRCIVGHEFSQGERNRNGTNPDGQNGR